MVFAFFPRMFEHSLRTFDSITVPDAERPALLSLGFSVRIHAYLETRNNGNRTGETERYDPTEEEKEKRKKIPEASLLEFLKVADRNDARCVS